MSHADESLMAGFAPASLEAWRKSVEKTLAGADFDKKLVSSTPEGIAIQPLYTERDYPHEKDLAGFAGAPPYRRGALPVGRSGERWDLRVRLDHPDPAQLRTELAAELKRGVGSLWLVLDKQARSGRSLPEPDRDAGAACVNAAQLGELLADVALDRVPVSIDAGGNALAAAACLASVASARGVAVEQLQGGLNADPLGALARDGQLPCSLGSAREQLVALAQWCDARAPKLAAVTVNNVPYHEAGAHAVQELGIALATGVTYLRWLTAAGLPIAAAAKQIAFRVAIGSDLFMEIAKLRALRECWSQVVAACGGDAEAQRAVIHATTSDRTKTKRDPWVNMLRETTEAFAASVGGADAITTGGFDRAIGASDELARRIASNVQLILDEESHVAQVADPAGGSFYVEKLTDEIARRAWSELQSIEKAGGMEAALQKGVIAEQIAATANARAANVAKRKQAITGVNEFAHVKEEPVVRSEPDWAAVAQARKRALEAGSRDEAVAKPLLQARGAGVASKDAALALVDAAISAAKNGANLGQLACALAGADATAKIDALPVRREAQAFEALRDAADQYMERTGTRPQAFLCNLGPIPQHKARAQFASGFLAAGGFEVLDNDGFETPAAAADAFAASGAKLAVLCGSDETYATWVAQVAPLLMARGATRIVLAGRPGEAEAQYRAAGMTDAIFMGADVAQTLKQLHAALGV